MGLLDNKNILVTGVLTDTSFGFHAARLAQEQGANVIVTGYGRLSLVQRIVSRLPHETPVLELDVTDADHLASLAQRIQPHLTGDGKLDGVVHAIAYAPTEALGGNFLDTEWDDVATAVHTSAYSLKSLTMACRPLFGRSASVVGLDFDAQVSWPKYDWMGVAKAAFESTSRYLARYLGPDGVRVNLVAAGPVKTMAARSIPGFDAFDDVWNERAPIGWDLTDAEPPAQACVALLSDWFPRTTGEIVHVDGGVHAVGA